MRFGPHNNVLNTLSISVEKKAPAKISKANFPLRYGRYAEIRTRDYEFRFNLNIGFESIHQSTLDMIGKPLDEMRVRDAFQKMQDVNSACEQVEITGNFIMGAALNSEHYQSIADLLQRVSSCSNKKGAVYLSPLKDSPKKRELPHQFNQIKEKSQLPVYAYLIQRF